MRALFALVVMTGIATAAPPVSLTVGTAGSALELTFTNTTQSEIKYETRIHADIDHYDWLSVTLTKGTTKRVFAFSEDRDKSAPVSATLAPGKATTERIDLAFWATRAANGAPLDAGTYDVALTWKAPTGTLTGKTTLVVAAPIETKGCNDNGAHGLVLLARVHPKSSTVDVGIHNIDKRNHCIAAYVHAGEKHHDHLTARVGAIELHFDDTRTKAFPIYQDLPPGATSWTTWDLAAWAKRPRNKTQTLPSGSTAIRLTYDAKRETSAWRGLLDLTVFATLP